ncbi:MAG: DUF3568 family protein [Gemmataceae bacterium]
MQGHCFRLRCRHAVLLLLAAAGLLSAGCCCVLVGAGVAGLAGGAGTGYFFAKGKMEQTYPTDYVSVWTAAHAALADLNLVIEKENLKRGIINSHTPEGKRVRLSVKEQHVKHATDEPRTRIAVRVGCFGDRAVSERILRQVALRLAPAVPVDRPAALSPVVPSPSRMREKD